MPKQLPDSKLVAEKCLATAHRSLSYAIFEASTWSDLGMHDDLQMVQLELERLQIDLLRGRARRSLSLINRAYLSDSPRDDGRSSTR